MQYLIESKNIRIEYAPERIALAVHVSGSEIVWQWADGGKLRLGDGTELLFSSGECQSCACKRGRVDGVKATYTNLRDAQGKMYPFTVETFVGVDQNTDLLRVQAAVTGDEPGNIAALVYPPRMQFDAPEGDRKSVV